MRSQERTDQMMSFDFLINQIVAFQPIIFASSATLSKCISFSITSSYDFMYKVLNSV